MSQFAMRPLRSLVRRHAFVFAAAVVCLTLTAVPARAQFYSFSGAVTSYPTNSFPISTSTAVLNIGSANTLSVGQGAVGSFSALAGAQLSTGGIEVASGRVGTGTFNVTGAQVQVGGTADLNRIQVGNWGTGTLVVSAGGLVDGTVNASVCLTAGARCNNYIGNGAGSDATLTITGAGSELRALRSFVVGGVSVFTQASSGFDFGTPGAATHGSVNVLAGGTLRTENVRLGVAPGGAAPLGTEQSFATAVIDGVGSQWIVTRNSIDNTAAIMSIGTSANATATVTVSGGGKLRIDGSGSVGPNDGVTVGNIGKGTLTITGSGSRLETVGVSPFINLGTNASTGDGTLKILSGATASSLFLNVGRNGGKGNLLIDGAGSQLTLSGVGTGAAFITVGWGGSTGSATISNGAHVFITDGGQDSRAGTGSPGFQIGRDAGGVGSLTVDGAGSLVQVVSSSIGPPLGVTDNFNPFAAVGRTSGSTGQLTVSGGAKIIMTGNALSTVAYSRTTGFYLGGDSDTTLGGNGTATITGAGSQLRVEGVDSFVAVGRNGTGTMTVSDQALVATRAINVGRASSGLGTLNVDHGTIELSGQQTGNVLAGSGLSVGVRGGAGTVTIGNASVVTMTNASGGAGLELGGSVVNPGGGTGVLNVSGGSQITITAAAGRAVVHVGYDGTGTATFSGGSVLSAAGGNVTVADQAGSTGTLTLNTGSVLNASYVGVGSKPGGPVGNNPSVPAGIDGGQGSLFVNSGSIVNTTTLEIGSHGLLGGDGGRINGNVISRGTIAPGNSPGNVTIDGAIELGDGSRVVLDIRDDGGGHFSLDQLILMRGRSFSFASVNVVFNFLGTTDPNAAANAGQLDLDNFLRVSDGATESGLSSAFGNGSTWNTVLSQATFSATSTAYDVTHLNLKPDGSGTFTFDVTPIPEPGTWLLWLSGLLLLGGGSWARRAPQRH